MQKTKNFIRFCIKTVMRISRWLEEHRIRVYASQASFFIIISAVPMLIMILALSAYFFPSAEQMHSVIAGVLPEELSSIARKLLLEISEKSNLSLLSVSAITLLWSASRGVRGIGAGIRNVYGTDRERHYITYILKSALLTLLYICSVILALIVWVFGDMILSRMSDGAPIGALKVLNGTALFLLLSAVFMLTYRMFGARKGEQIKEAPGAFLSAAGWFVFSAVFEYYVEHFGRYSYVYGSLASLIVVMLWLYSCMEILLIGAGINMLLSKKVRFI